MEVARLGYARRGGEEDSREKGCERLNDGVSNEGRHSVWMANESNVVSENGQSLYSPSIVFLPADQPHTPHHHPRLDCDRKTNRRTPSKSRTDDLYTYPSMVHLNERSLGMDSWDGDMERGGPRLVIGGWRA